MLKDVNDWPTDEELKTFLNSLDKCISLRQTPDEISSFDDFLQPKNFECVRYVGALWPLAKVMDGVLIANTVHIEKHSGTADDEEAYRAYLAKSDDTPLRILTYDAIVYHDEVLDKDTLLVLNGVWFNQEHESVRTLKALIFDAVYEHNKKIVIDQYRKMRCAKDVDGNSLIPSLEDIEGAVEND